VILLVLASLTCSRFGQAPVVTGSNKQPGGEAVASHAGPQPANVQPENVVVTSEKPTPPPGLPLEKYGVICALDRAGKKRVALTFDDGPSPMTPEYLRVLQEKGVHATFFLIGKNVQRYPDLAAMITGGGNEIGNHTFSHLDLRKSPLADDVKDILAGQEIIEQETRQKLHLLRPPGGDLSVPVIRQIQKMGYTIVFWDIDPQDWRESATPAGIIDNIMSNLRPGAIILLHEGKPGTLKALPEIIDDIRRQGYEIGTVSDLFAASNLQPGVATQANTAPAVAPNPQPGVTTNTAPATVPEPQPGVTTQGNTAPATAQEPEHLPAGGG
jgi:peptidoglycan/xylan/chitin deacetylase (PgdA/CDA1 family)